MPICLECCAERLLSVCGYCGECAHLCKAKCPKRVRIQKEQNAQRAREREFNLIDVPVKKYVDKNGKKRNEYLSSNYGSYRPHHA